MARLHWLKSHAKQKLFFDLCHYWSVLKQNINKQKNHDDNFNIFRITSTRCQFLIRVKILLKCSFEFAFAWYVWISPNWIRPLSFPTVPYWLTTSPLTMSSSTMGHGIGLIEFCMYISSVHLPNVPDIHSTTFTISTNSIVCANVIN